MILETCETHRIAILDLLRESGHFDEAGMQHVDMTLEEHLQSPGESIWLTAMSNDLPVGVAYCAPEPMTSGTWNLLMLWVSSEAQGQGHGMALVDRVEDELKKKAARLLIVETTQLEEFETARRFYEKAGFKLEAEVKDFFEVGSDKLIYTKSLNFERQN